MGPIKSKSILGILFLVFIFFVLLMALGAYTIKSLSDGKIVGKIKDKKGDKIGVVEVNGIIMESRPVIELLQEAEEDEDIKAIIVRINSPGGAVSPTQEIYEEIRRIDQGFDSEEKEGRPIYASLSSIAASGGYYVGAAARKIYANPGTLTGSIGVIMSFVDMAELYEWAKLRPEVIKSGRYKDMGAPHRAMEDHEKQLLERMALNVHQQFVEDVLETRKDKIKTDIEDITDGRIFSGKTALENGLVDELSSLWGAGRKIHKELKLEGDFNLKFITKKKSKSLFDIVDRLDKIISHTNWKGILQPAPIFLAQ